MEKFRGELLLLLSSILFGFSFICQKTASLYINSYITNASRFIIGALFLTPFLFKKDNTDTKLLLKYGALLGLILFLAPNFQQIAVAYVNVGKVSFISACYIFFVPIINFLFLKKKARLNIIISLIFALFGLIFLCNISINDLSIQKYDIFLLICAILYAVQIVILGKATKKVSAIKLSCVQYYFVFIFNLIMCFINKDFNINNFKLALPSILFLGLGATTIAYTLQAVGQKSVHSNIAAFIISLESVFGLIAGIIFLNQTPSVNEIIGCILIFIGVVISTLPLKKHNKSYDKIN